MKTKHESQSLTQSYSNQKTGQYKEVIVALVWCSILAGWLSWSYSNEEYLLTETLPAFFIVTFLCLIKSIETTKNKS
ncbi:MAG: hypothetical protein P1U56_03610 [Saprospiraceae bacterium]|nr:hypothetical protein [Saprospiraceae bacterium]